MRIYRLTNREVFGDGLLQVLPGKGSAGRSKRIKTSIKKRSSATVPRLKYPTPAIYKYLNQSLNFGLVL